MLNKLLKGKVRVVIPFKDEDNYDFIEIKNPSEKIIKDIKTRIVNRVNGKDDFDNNEMLEFLIKELTNVNLNIKLEELIMQDISHECKMMLFHITEIYNEIQTEVLSIIKMELSSKRVKKLEEEITLEMHQV